MRAHKVISAFKVGGTLISPPAEWTPPSQAKADRLITAGCLKAPKDGEPTATEIAAGDQPDSTGLIDRARSAVTGTPAKGKGKGGRRGGK